MSSIPSNLSRSPSLLIQQIQLDNITRTNIELFEVQNQLATGRAVNRASDDPVAAVTIATLDDSIERSDQRLRNLDQADTNLALIETSLSEANDLLLSAKSIASEQVNLGSTTQERANQALIVDSQIAGLLEQMNRSSGDVYLFSGSRTSQQPFEQFGTGIIYTGEFSPMTTDLGLGSSVPVTLDGIDSIGQAGRVNGTTDLDPRLTLSTRLDDLDGARGLGISRGPVEVVVAPSGDTLVIDLSDADTTEDVTTRLDAAIGAYESTTGSAVLGAGRIGIADDRFTVDTAPGVSLNFTDIGTGTTAQDLGLVPSGNQGFDAGNPNGAALGPRLALDTPVASLAGLIAPLDQIELTNAGRRVQVDLSGAQTIEDIKNLIETSGAGVEVMINQQGTGIDIVNLVSAPPDDSLIISDTPGGSNTADLLGIRTFTSSTRTDRLNDGRGVQIATGGTNPDTGAADTSLDIDFAITLGDGREITVNLRPEDIGTVGAVVDRINAEAATQGVAPNDFQAELGDGPGGLKLVQNGAFADPLAISQRNNSQAMFDLGLADGTYDATSATLTGQDRSGVVTDTVFTRLLELRDGLAEDDTDGITFAGERLEGVIDGVAQTRGLVGGFGQRLASASDRELNVNLFNQSTRSELRDLDFAEGATRLTQLQNQLQAALQTASISTSLSLLDFLG
ncbi:MAG: flagellin [Planctomycetota bacterium]